MRFAAKPSRRVLIIGIPPATAASNITVTCFSSAAAKISLPYSANNFLLAVTTCLPFSIAFKIKSLAMPVPPMSSTTISISGCVTTVNASSVSVVSGTNISVVSKSLRLSAAINRRICRPVRRSISAALRFKTFAVPPPTVPKPKIPTLMGFIECSLKILRSSKGFYFI